MNQIAHTTQLKKIESLVEHLNEDWLNDRLENMEMYFHNHVVMVLPGTNKKIAGREQMIESYRDFMETADVSDFKIMDLFIDVFETTAIAFYTFRIKYSVETTHYDERGNEMLVFNRHNDEWKVVWRHQNPAEVS